MRLLPSFSPAKLPASLALLGLAVLMSAFLACSHRDPSFPQGEMIYKTNCLACHGPDGNGVLYSQSFLNNNPHVTGDPDEVIAVILFGKQGTSLMPGWAKNLNDQSVAAVATYIRQAWSNQASAVTPAMVTKVRNKAGKGEGTAPPQK
jgi:mono/diheme cytochrome c family protein